MSFATPKGNSSRGASIKKPHPQRETRLLAARKSLPLFTTLNVVPLLAWLRSPTSFVLLRSSLFYRRSLIPASQKKFQKPAYNPYYVPIAAYYAVLHFSAFFRVKEKVEPRPGKDDATGGGAEFMVIFVGRNVSQSC